MDKPLQFMIIKYIVPFLCLAFGSISACSQNLDSLKALFAAAEGKERVDVLYELSSNLLRKNQTRAIQYGLEGYLLSHQLCDSTRLVRIGRVTAKALRAFGKMDSAIHIYEVILPISEKMNLDYERIQILNAYALALTFSAQYDKALNYHFQSLNIRSVHNDTLSIITTLHNIGLVYYKLEDYRTALSYFTQCRDLKIKFKDNFDLDILMFNMGLCYGYLQRFKEARLYIGMGFEACGRICSPARLMESAFALGVTSFGLKDYRQAESEFLRSYSIAKKLEDVRFQLDNIDYISKIYLAQGRHLEASSYLESAINLIGENTFFNLENMKIYFRLAQLYSGVCDFENAYHFQWLYSQLKDSVYNEETTRNLMKAEANFLERENSSMISTQNQMLVLKEELIRQERGKNKVLVLLAVLFAGFLFLVLRAYKYKRKLNSRLERKVFERTQELQRSRDELLTALLESDVIFRRASEQLGATLTTIKGLCCTGMKEIPDSTAQEYLRKIELSSCLLVNYFSGDSEKLAQKTYDSARVGYKCKL
ncbi:MAG: tetratricopeptide repeat protein [Chryseosolibacter sp.]